MAAFLWIRAALLLFLTTFVVGFGLTESGNSYIVDTSAGLIFTGMPSIKPLTLSELTLTFV